MYRSNLRRERERESGGGKKQERASEREEMASPLDEGRDSLRDAFLPALGESEREKKEDRGENPRIIARGAIPSAGAAAAAAFSGSHIPPPFLLSLSLSQKLPVFKRILFFFPARCGACGG